MSLTRSSRPRPSAPGPADDPWIALLVAGEVALAIGFLAGWEAAATVLVAVLSFLSAYREPPRH